MTDWSAMLVFRDVLVNYYFGNQEIFYGGVMILFLLALVMAGIDFPLAVVFTLPLVAGLVLAGLFLAHSWILPVAMMLIAVIYAYALIDLFT